MSSGIAWALPCAFLLAADGLQWPPADQRLPLAYYELAEAYDSCSEGRLLEEDFLRDVANGTLNRQIAGSWERFQGALVEKMQRTYPRQPDAFNVLIVCPVRNSPRAVDDFEFNLKRLTRNRVGDVFDFALFHYDNSTSAWLSREWYRRSPSRIVMKEVGFFCKAQVWAQITPEMAKQYDYVWLMDGDLRFDFFSWDLYRSVLAALRPLVSQPAIVPKSPAQRSTDIDSLRMVGWTSGAFPVAREVRRSETMAPLLSTRLWSALYERLQLSDLHTVWFLNSFWDMAAYLTASACDSPGVLLVNGSPLRHMNCHDLFTPELQRPFNCTRGCGQNHSNCRPVSYQETTLMRRGLRGFCDVSGARHCSEGIKKCYSSLVNSVHKREWVDVQGGPSSGNISVFKYRCDAPPEVHKETRVHDRCQHRNISDPWPTVAGKEVVPNETSSMDSPAGG